MSASASAGGVLFGLRNGSACPAGDRRDLEVERGRVGQRRQLLAEPLVQLALGPQARGRDRVLASCLLEQVAGALLGGREKQFIPNGPGRLPTLRSRPRAADGSVRRTGGGRPSAPAARAVGLLLRGAEGGATERAPPVPRVVHRSAARLRRVGLQAVLLLPSRSGRPLGRPPAGAAGPGAPLLVRDGCSRRVAHELKSISPTSVIGVTDRVKEKMKNSFSECQSRYVRHIVTENTAKNTHRARQSRAPPPGTVLDRRDHR